MAAADTARLIASLELDPRKFQRGTQSALGSLNKLDRGLGSTIGRAGKNLGKAGLAIGAAVGGGLVLAGKAAIDFQDAFQGVVKTVDAKELAAAHLTFDDLSDSIRKMSREMPNSAIELAGIAEQAGALGIKAGDIEAFTRQVAILASTTNVSADDAATALGQLQNVIGLTGDEFDNFAAALVDLGNKGASTEADILEIARRSGQAAKLFGIAKDQTLGWAAAAANLGLNQELAGTSLQNVFVKLLPKVSQGSKTLSQVFAGVFGKTKEQAQKVLGKDVPGSLAKMSKQVAKLFKKDASGALDQFIHKLAKLPKDARLNAVQDIFGKGSGITRLVLGLADSVDKNLDPALRDSTKAWKDATAAQAEFDKRNATVRSAISRLKNNLVDAAVTIGEGFAPAVGRAADKLSKFLSDPQNRKALQDIGKDIGKAIDSIDWDKILDAAKGIGKAFGPALSVLQQIASLVAGLPPGVLGAGAGLVITDKVTGGAISSAIGGALGGLGSSLAKSLAASVPLFGKAFVQPVFVTNPGFGGPGGVPGGGPAGGGTAEGGGGAKAGGTAGAAIFIANLPEFEQTSANALRDANKQNTPLFNRMADALERQAKQPTPWDAILEAIGLKEKPAADQNGVLADTGKTFGQLVNQKLQPPLSEVIANTADTYTAMLENKVATTTSGDAIKAATALGARDVSSTTRSGTSGTTAAVNTSRSAIVGAIASNRPIVTTNVDVNVTATSVTKATTTSTRYGGGTGSFGGGTGGGGSNKYD